MNTKTITEVYLDANATTPVLPAAVDKAHDAMQELYGNPSSSHTSGLRARHILESARDLVRQVLGAKQGQIVFTSGATEAIQMGVFSTLCKIHEQRMALNNLPRSGDQQPNEIPDNRILLYGATEHKAVPQALKHWNRLLGVNNEIVEIPVDRNGLLDLEFLARHASRADLICTMAVNNETGVVTDLVAVESIIRRENETAAWLVDCVQAVGKLTLDLGKTTIDYAAISGHKIYAPKGIGLLYVRPNTTLVPLIAGGGQEQGARGGTENLPGVAAIAAVLERLAMSESRTFCSSKKLEQYRERIVAELKQAFPSIVFNMPFQHSVATTINFAVKGFPSKELLDLFDAAGIRVSSGSACGSGVQGSYVLEAMGLPRWQSDGAIRLSFGPLATELEIDTACRRIQQAGRALCESCLVVSPDTDQTAKQPLDGLVQLKNGSMCTWMLMDAKSKRCIIIDPFAELTERIESLVRCQQSRIVAVLDTHAHVDHDSCRLQLLEALSEQMEDSAKTDDLLGWPETADGTATLPDGTAGPYLKLSDDAVITQINLPGHTEVGRAFLVGRLTENNQLLKKDIRFVFSGDMILTGGLGRTDFASSSPAAMYRSLRRLPELIAASTVICPTHDYTNDFATTLGAETRNNEFLRKILDPISPLPLPEFLQLKSQIDAGIDDASNSELVCGLIRSALLPGELSKDLYKHELKDFFQQHRQSLVIDVREPQEFAFAQDWSELGIFTPPENVPLTRLAGYLPQLLGRFTTSSTASPAAGIEVIFVCRSGKRSGKAAEIARRFGIENARHIAGGIALNVTRHRAPDDPLAELGYVI